MNDRTLDIVAVFALLIGLLNIAENRKQTKQNDVHRENAEQLEEINLKFDELKELILSYERIRKED